jgi:FkbM family methyltransferase
MGIATTLNFILTHPLNAERKLAAIMRFVRWQIGSRIMAAPVAKPFVEHTRLLVSRGMTGATQNIYCGLHEFEDMAFVLHALRADDLFVDVGANVGSYTLLAGGVVGAQCISLEPVPETFAHLCDNINLNGIADRVSARNVAAGEARGTLRFTAGLDTVNHVLAEDEVQENAIMVGVERLDDLLAGRKPLLIKIDVEGFETKVILGAHALLSSPSLLGVIMELNGSGSRYGFDEDALHARMLEYGFKAYSYRPIERELVVLDNRNVHAGNTLYLRGETEIRARIGSARKFMTNLGIEV